MGIVIKHRKKYSSHKKRWEKKTITDEGLLVNDYAIKNKKEIRKLEFALSKYKRIAKGLNRNPEENKEQIQHFIDKLKAFGFLTIHATTLDEVLDIELRNLLERRLSNQVYRKQYARSPKQARQFVVHGHVKVNGRVVTSPSYLVTLQDEPTIEFLQTSALADENHPERKIEVETVEENSSVNENLGENVPNDDSFDKKEARLDDQEVDEGDN